MIAAENAVYSIRRPHMLGEQTNNEETLAEKIFHYRHPIVAGTFAAAVGVGAMLYARDPYRSGTQKFLNVRLYGQGLALAALFGTIGLGTLVAQKKQLEQEQRDREALAKITGDKK